MYLCMPRYPRVTLPVLPYARTTLVRTGRGARVRSRPLAYIRTGCMHIVVQCKGPALATVEVNKTTLPENQDGLGGRGGPICSLGLCRPNGENADACDTATPSHHSFSVVASKFSHLYLGLSTVEPAHNRKTACALCRSRFPVVGICTRHSVN